MAINFKEIKEKIRIKGDQLTIKLLAFTGKEGEHYVAISPTLLVSGYGATEDEAKVSFEENIRLFCEDFMKLSPEKRESELIKLGFTKVKYHNKDFSKAYVDENGVLQGFEPGTLKTAVLEETF